MPKKPAQPKPFHCLSCKTRFAPSFGERQADGCSSAFGSKGSRLVFCYGSIFDGNVYSIRSASLRALARKSPKEGLCDLCCALMETEGKLVLIAQDALMGTPRITDERQAERQALRHLRESAERLTQRFPSP